MKKVYKKPEVLFESFALSTSIAGDCGIKTDLQSQYVCGLDFGDGEVIFSADITGCSTQIEDGMIYVPDQNGDTNPICYHQPSDTNRLFGS